MAFELIICITIFGILLPLNLSDNACRFESNEGVIDLSSVGETNGEAKYKNGTTPLGPEHYYNYNPCHPFTKAEGHCRNVAICQVAIVDPDGLTYNLGIQESAKWFRDASADDGLIIRYEAGGKVSYVHLNCSIDESEKFEVIDENPPGTYTFRLTHMCACWNACNNTLTTTTTTTTTSIITTTTTSVTTTTNNGQNNVIPTVLSVILLFLLAFL